MQLEGKALRVIIYIGESDHYRGKALHMALLEMLKQKGAAGATVMRGLAGFGAHSRIHTATILTLSEDLPLRLEWVDQPEVVERLLPTVRGMVNDGLITIEEVQVVQYAPGRELVAMQQPVSNVMRTEVTSVTLQTPVNDVVGLLLRRGRRSVPVLDEAGRVSGIITDGDLLRRAGMAVRLDLQSELSEEQVRRQVRSLQEAGQTAADIMTGPVVTIQMDSTMQQAMDLMVRHGLKRLPVVDQDERLVGWISRVDVLRAFAYHHLSNSGRPQPKTGHTVSELMYREVPTIAPGAPLEEIIEILEAGHYRRAVVADDEGRVLGIITDGDLLRRSSLARYPRFLARLRSLITGQPARIRLPDSGETAAMLMSHPVATIREDTTLVEALQMMLTNQCKRLPVVDDEGHLVGLLGRASLMRGLLQDNGKSKETG